MKEINIVAQKLIEQKRETVAEIIQTARVQKGWSQTDLAERVGFSRSTIARIEACNFSPNADQLYLILDCLDLPLQINNLNI